MKSYTDVYTRLEAFKELTQGWNHGEGDAISLRAIEKAKEVVYKMECDGENHPEVFPDVNGGVQVVHYIKYLPGEYELVIDIDSNGYLSKTTVKPN